MDEKKLKKRIQELSEEIEAHNYRYYVLDQPTISDREYDELLKELISLEEQFPHLKDPNSPSQRVGVKLQSAANTVTHRARMYSLDNTYSIDEVRGWHERVVKGLHNDQIDYVIEMKIDGVSASLTYNKGVFVLGATRGDVVTGEGVTHSLKTIRSIPLHLHKAAPYPNSLDVRAEIFMNRTVFEE